MKTKSSKKVSKNQNKLVAFVCRKSVWLPGLILVLAVQSVAIFVLYVHSSMVSMGVFGKAFWPAFGPDELMQSSAGYQFKDTIRGSVETAYAAPVASAQEERLYFPEVRVHIPLTSENRHLLYNFANSSESGTDRTHDTLQINTTRNIANIIHIQTMRAISCGQMAAIIRFTPSTEESFTKEATLQTVALADGRTLYINEIRRSDCSHLDPQAPDSILSAFKNAQSY